MICNYLNVSVFLTLNYYGFFTTFLFFSVMTSNYHNVYLQRRKEKEGRRGTEGELDTRVGTMNSDNKGRLINSSGLWNQKDPPPY